MLEENSGHFSLTLYAEHKKKKSQCPKLISMINILDLFSVAFWLKEMLTKGTVYSGNLSSHIIVRQNQINTLLSTSSSS